MKRKFKKFYAMFGLAIALLLSACTKRDVETVFDIVEYVADEATTTPNEDLGPATSDEQPDNTSVPEQTVVNNSDYSAEIPGPEAFDGQKAYAVINWGEPFFTDDEKGNTEAFEIYSELDELGRCGVAYANICPELMPTEERGEIGSVKPTGWHTVKYDQISGRYLYNRCHLIGFQLAGENANEKNLITGTRYLNVEGMLPFENEIADYVKKTGNHVLYRVTPIFEGDNLVANGVLMEAWSVEDNGVGVKFNIFCYNVQPFVGIDYATGDSWDES